MRNTTTTKPRAGAQLDWGNPINRSLLAWWLFNEGAGLRVADLCGKHHGTLTNMPPRWAGSPHGGSVDLDGGNDYVLVGDYDDLSFGDSVNDSPFSVMCWACPRDATNFCMVTKTTSFGSGAEWAFEIDDGDDIRFSCYDNGSSNRIGREHADVAGITENRWSQYAGTYDGSGDDSGLKIYFNGQQVTTSPTTGGSYVAMHSGSQDVCIGVNDRDSTQRFADGKIDDVRIYGRELTAAEIYDIWCHPYDGLLIPQARTYFVPTVAAAALLPRSLHVSQAVQRASTW